jgi:hypothetical protein
MTDSAQFASPGTRDNQDTRRAKVAPLLAAGLSVRAISAETGIPVGAVHRAKRQLEKIVAQGEQKAAAVSPATGRNPSSTTRTRRIIPPANSGSTQEISRGPLSSGPTEFVAPGPILWQIAHFLKTTAPFSTS